MGFGRSEVVTIYPDGFLQMVRIFIPMNQFFPGILPPGKMSVGHTPEKCT